MGPPAMTRRLDLFKSSKHLTLYINIFKEVGAPLTGRLIFVRADPSRGESRPRVSSERTRGSRPSGR